MPIRFRCKCGKDFKVDDQYAGKRVKCPACGIAMVVPVPSPPSEPEPPQPAGELELEMEAPQSLSTNAEAEPVSDLILDEPPEPVQAQPEPEPEPIAEEAVAEDISPVSELVEAIPLDAEAQDAPEGENACSNCGAPLAADALICTQCGGEVGAAQPKGPSVPVPTKPPSKMKWVIMGAAGVVVLAGIIIGIVLLSRKSPEESATAASGTAPVERTGARRPKKPAPAKAPPKIVVAWEGFQDPALHTRDKLLALGESLAAFNERNNRFPGDLAELGAFDTAGIVYVGGATSRLERFRPLAHASKADPDGRISVLFSDGTVRAVEEAGLDSVLLSRQPAGWMTGPDAALLAQLGPRLRVSNPRFAELEVSLDDGVLGIVKKGESETFSVGEGTHRVAFRARGKQSGNVALTCDAGILYEFTFHRHQDLPAIAAYEYRNALSQEERETTSSQRRRQGETLYQVQREEEQITGLSGEKETVHFTDGASRPPISRDYRIVRGWIEREHLKIEGLEGAPILVSEYGRLEQGVVRYTDGQEIVYRRTGLGTVAVHQMPNVEVAAFARFGEMPQVGAGALRGGQPVPLGPRGPQGQPPRPGGGPAAQPETPDRGPGGGMGLIQRAQAMEHRRPGPGSPMSVGAGPGPSSIMDTGRVVVSLDIDIPDMVFSAKPDCQALALTLHQSGSGITPLLMRQIDAISEPETSEQDQDTRRDARDRAVSGLTRRSYTRPARGGPGRPGIGSRSPQRGFGRQVSAEQVAVVPLGHSKPLAQVSIADLIATLAVHGGNSSAVLQLSTLFESMAPNAPGYDELIIALARCGGAQALHHINLAAAEAPQQAAIALAMIDTTAARSALRDIMSGWSAEEVHSAVEIWPDVAGISARTVWIEELAGVQPALLEDLTALNALLKLDAYTVERLLLDRLLNRNQPVTEDPKEETEEAEEPQSGRTQNRRGRAASVTPEEALARGRAGPGGRGRPGGGGAQQTRGAAARTSGDTIVPASWQVLARLKNTEAIEHMVALLNGDDLAKKRAAMVAISETADASLLPTAIALLEDRDAVTREYAVRLLVALGNQKAVKTLHEAMRAELLFAAIPDAASELASKAGRDVTIELLAKMLEMSVAETSEATSIATPKAIVEALVTLKANTEHVRAVIETARASDDPATRVAAYEAIAGFSAPAASKPGKGSMVRGLVKIASLGRLKGGTRSTGTGAMEPTLAEALRDSSPEVRAAGVALMRGQPAEDVAPLLERLESDSSAEVRRSVMETVAMLEGDSLHVTQILSDGLNDLEPEVVIAAAKAAVQRHQSGLGFALETALNVPSSEAVDRTQAQIALIEACGELGERNTIQRLALLLGDEDPEIREAAARALGAIGDDNAVYALNSVQEDTDENVRAAGLIALSHMDSRNAINISLDALSSENLGSEIRVELLTRLVSECANPGVYADWLGRSGELDETSLQTLVEIASEQSTGLKAGFIHLAKRYLSSEEGHARPYAAQMLACYASDPEVRKVLLSAFEQDATDICDSVAQVLEEIDDPAMLPSLWKLYRAIDVADQSGRDDRTRSTLQGVGSTEAHVLVRAIVKGMSNIKGDQAAQMLWRIGRAETHAGRTGIALTVLDALPRTESPMAVTYLGEALVETRTRADLFGIQVARSLEEIGHLEPREARLALLKIARSHITRAAAVAADALETLEEANSSSANSSAGG